MYHVAIKGMKRNCNVDIKSALSVEKDVLTLISDLKHGWIISQETHQEMRQRT